MSNIGFSSELALDALQMQMNDFSALYGGLTKIDNDGTRTIAVYDPAAPAGTIVLRTESPSPRSGETVIATGRIFISAQLQQVTAYRT